MAARRCPTTSKTPATSRSHSNRTGEAEKTTSVTANGKPADTSNHTIGGSGVHRGSKKTDDLGNHASSKGVHRDGNNRNDTSGRSSDTPRKPRQISQNEVEGEPEGKKSFWKKYCSFCCF